MMSRTRCLMQDHEQLVSQNTIRNSKTYQEQAEVEQLVRAKFELFREQFEHDAGFLPELHRDLHEQYLMKGLLHLSESYQSLDASRPWLVYWIVHSLALLGVHFTEHNISCGIAQFLNQCQHPEGGFCGGPGQYPHLATTYAAVNAICSLANEDAFKIINRGKLYNFLKRLRQPDGSFAMHDGGEIDIRGVYCAASVARLTNIATEELFEGVPQWIIRCQTYEGGFGGTPGAEAHGGYSFCGIAALILLGHEKLCDIKSLLRWTANRQLAYEGGFQGRTNKLVDGCYSFWQGGAFPLIHMVLTKEGNAGLSPTEWMFDQQALQEYILVCCQNITGGLMDKPNKNRDFYHTAYCLSGLSVAQHFAEHKLFEKYVVGSENNELKETHPLFNICLEAVTKSSLYFSQLPHPKDS